MKYVISELFVIVTINFTIDAELSRIIGLL